MYASVRSYRVAGGSIDELMRRVDQEFAPMVEQAPGFLAYHVLDKGDGIIVSLSLFRDEAGVTRSNEMATEWVRERLSDFAITPLGVMAGEVEVSRAIAEVLEPAGH